MSLKTLSKTRWKIEPDRVTLYPSGSFYILSLVVAVLFGGIVLLYANYSNPTTFEVVGLAIFLLFFIILFWSGANTRIEFDNVQGVMRKKLMGFLPVTTLPMNKLQGINAVTNLAGSYNYRMFKKNERYGKGIVVSSSYTKNDDPNAIAFVNEVVPIIHSYLDKHDAFAGNVVAAPITDFKYFKENGGVYTVKNKKIGGLIFGLFFIGIAVYLFNIPTDSATTSIIMVVVMLLLGLVFINAAFTNFILNPAAQTVERKGLFSFMNKHYAMANFVGIQTVRHSVNLVYTGTSINLHFRNPNNSSRNQVLTIGSLRRAKHIDRFMDELHQIMNI